MQEFICNHVADFSAYSEPLDARSTCFCSGHYWRCLRSLSNTRSTTWYIGHSNDHNRCCFYSLSISQIEIFIFALLRTSTSHPSIQRTDTHLYHILTVYKMTTTTAKLITADVLVLGGGLAGLAAATSLSRQMIPTVIFDSGNYRNAPTAHMPGRYIYLS